MNGRDLFALGGTGGGDSEAFAEGRETAAINFEPVDSTALKSDLTEPAWSKMVGGLGVWLRVAAALTGDTKAGLVEFARGLIKTDGGDALFETIDGLGETAEHLKSLAEIAETASMRLLVATAVIATAGGDDGSAA